MSVRTLKVVAFIGFGLVCSASPFEQRLVVADDVRVLNGHQSLVSQLVFSPDSRVLASSSCDKTVKLWSVETGVVLKTLEGHQDFVWGVAFSPDATRLASASWDGTIRIWDAKDGRHIHKLSVEGERAKSVAFAPDGKLLASISTFLQLWNTETWTPMEPPLGTGSMFPGFSFPMVAFDAKGQRLCCTTCIFGNTFWKFDPDSETFILEKPPLFREGGRIRRNVYRFALRPDGRCLAVPRVFDEREWTIEIWDIDTATNLCVLEGHKDEIRSMAFSSDGKRLVSGGDDKMVKIWDVGNAREEVTLKGHTDEVWAVAISPDGKYVASGGQDTTVRLWPIPQAQNKPE